MPTASPIKQDLDTAVLREAADWLVLLQSGDATDADRAALVRWRARSAMHEAAWRRAEDLLAAFSRVPPRLARGTLNRLGGLRRRQMLRLGLIGIALPGAWLALRHSSWQGWTADLRTGVGAQRTVTLADGSRLVLNTSTAVDVAFGPKERRLTLVHGEIVIATSTARDESRPFVVGTADGDLRALGTRYAVRRTGDDTFAAVLEGGVEIRPAATADFLILSAGQQTTFSTRRIGPPRPTEPGVAAWEQGMLLARDMRLGDAVDELGRYHRGLLRCDPRVAHMTVSGAFPLDDIQASVDLLGKTLALRISRVSPYWVTLQPR